MSEGRNRVAGVGVLFMVQVMLLALKAIPGAPLEHTAWGIILIPSWIWLGAAALSLLIILAVLVVGALAGIAGAARKSAPRTKLSVVTGGAK